MGSVLVPLKREGLTPRDYSGMLFYRRHPPLSPKRHSMAKVGSNNAMSSSTIYNKRYSIAFVSLVLVLITIYALRHSFRETINGEDLFPPSKSNQRTNVAAIIENRPLSNIAPLLLHFSAILGPDWPIVLFTAEGNEPGAPAFRRAIENGRISVRYLPADIQFDKHQAVSEFLTTPWFWEQLAPAGHIFMFQADSIVCTNADLRVDDFLEYDFVGAPIDVPKDPPNGHGEGYNGGFSLRNRTMMLDIVNRFSWQEEKDAGKISQAGCVTQEPCLKFEDQWFYHKMKDMSEARLPTQEVASHFAVETIWYDKPLGYHQVERWNSDKMDKVAEWCPEYALATTDLLVKHPATGK